MRDSPGKDTGGIAFSFARGLPNPGSSPHLQKQVLYTLSYWVLRGMRREIWSKDNALQELTVLGGKRDEVSLCKWNGGQSSYLFLTFIVDTLSQIPKQSITQFPL